jgi:hypothetical protein
LRVDFERGGQNLLRDSSVQPQFLTSLSSVSSVVESCKGGSSI